MSPRFHTGALCWTLLPWVLRSLVYLKDDMLCSLGLKEYSWKGGWEERTFQIPSPLVLQSTVGLAKYPLSFAVLTWVSCYCYGGWVRVRVFVSMYVHDWPWLNMACGIHSDYGWASLLCNQTNWLTSRVWGWTEFLLWLPLCWVLSTCQPGAEKWEARVLKNRSKDSSSGSSLSIFPPRQLYSQMERGHIHEYRVDPLSAWTGERHDHSHTAVLASCQSNQNPPQMEATKTWPLKTAPQPR